MQQVDAIQSLATHDIDEGYVNMILTYDQSSEAIEKMEDDLGFEDISLADLDSTTAYVYADDLHEELKLITSFEKAGTQKCALDIFDPKEMASAFQTQFCLQGRPVAAIYRGDEVNVVYLRICVSDVAFLHVLRDKVLEGAADGELCSTLARLSGHESLGHVKCSIDPSHFA